MARSERERREREFRQRQEDIRQAEGQIAHMKRAVAEEEARRENASEQGWATLRVVHEKNKEILKEGQHADRQASFIDMAHRILGNLKS